MTIKFKEVITLIGDNRWVEKIVLFIKDNLCWSSDYDKLSYNYFGDIL